MFGAGLLLLASLAATTQPSQASDIGEVVHSLRMSSYPLHEPERRAWSTENTKDALVVGQMENRLFLYRYVRGIGQPPGLDFRSQPLVIDPLTWDASRNLAVMVRLPDDTGSLYWVGYHYAGDDLFKRADGFLVDAQGRAATVLADSNLAVVTSNEPWDEVRKAQALATLRQALEYPGQLRSFPAEVRFEHQMPLDVAATFMMLHQVTRAIPRTKKVEFSRALADLRRFVMEQDYREIDLTGKDPEMLTALNDYGFWLAESGDTIQADIILSDVLRRDPSRTAAYLNRADSRWTQVRKTGGTRGVLAALALEDYRLYCSRRLAAGDPIPSNIAKRISNALNANVLNAEVCRPRLAIFHAIQADDLNAVRAELAAGQDPNGVNENGTSALAAAVSRKQLDIVQTLLTAGARADGQNNGMLLLAGAMPNVNDRRPAAERYALADMLLAAGAPLDGVDSSGVSLLTQRTSYFAEDKDSLRYLLAKGANPNAREKNSATALHEAMRSPSKLWLTELLLDKGADINAAYIRMYYGNQAMWETPLLEALRDASSSELTPTVTYPVSERVRFALARGADPAVGGYSINRTTPERNGLNEALGLAAEMMQPELVDQLAQAAGQPQLPLTPDPLASLLRVWNTVEIRSSINKNSADWDGQRAKLRATAERLLAAGVPLTRTGDVTGLTNNIAPLGLPWLPDDLYLEWLEKGADASDRTRGDIGIQGVADADALPLVIMLQQGKETKAQMLLEHDAGLYRTPERCGMAVADMLAWHVSDSGPVSPIAARALSQVLARAEGAAGCDLTQKSRVQPFVGVSASDLADRANLTLDARASK